MRCANEDSYLRSDVSSEAVIGDGSTVWHLAQVREGAVLGKNYIVVRGVYIGKGVEISDNCKVQKYSLVYESAKLGDKVFIVPVAVLTNDLYPRAMHQAKTE